MPKTLFERMSEAQRPPMTDTASLVSRLRDQRRYNPDGPEAADTIEAQADEIATLKRKLRELGVEPIDNVDEHLAALKEQQP
jgi:hypothetical protein